MVAYKPQATCCAESIQEVWHYQLCSWGFIVQFVFLCLSVCVFAGTSMQAKMQPKSNINEHSTTYKNGYHTKRIRKSYW